MGSDARDAPSAKASVAAEVREGDEEAFEQRASTAREGTRRARWEERARRKRNVSARRDASARGAGRTVDDDMARDTLRRRGRSSREGAEHGL